MTESGIDSFCSWMRAPVTGSDLETAGLSKLYFLGLITESADRITILDDIGTRIEEEIQTLQSLDAALEELEIPAEERLVFGLQRDTLRYGLAAHRMGIQFFQELSQRETRGSQADGHL